MEMKDKLYCHHKSKISLVMKRFSLTCLGLISVISAIIIPTYISTTGNSKVVTEAQETKADNDLEENVEEKEENDNPELEDNLLAYE